MGDSKSQAPTTSGSKLSCPVSKACQNHRKATRKNIMMEVKKSKRVAVTNSERYLKPGIHNLEHRRLPPFDVVVEETSSGNGQQMWGEAIRPHINLDSKVKTQLREQKTLLNKNETLKEEATVTDDKSGSRDFISLKWSGFYVRFSSPVARIIRLSPSVLKLCEPAQEGAERKEDDDDGEERMEEKEDDDDGEERMEEKEDDDDGEERMEEKEDDDDGEERMEGEEDDDEDVLDIDAGSVDDLFEGLGFTNPEERVPFVRYRKL